MGTKVKLSDAERIARRKASRLAWYYRNRESALAYKAKYDQEHKEHRSAYGKAHEEKNKIRRRAQKKIYRAENKERAAAQYLANKDAVLAKCAANYAANAERIKRRVKEYAAANKDKVRLLSSDKRARKKTAGAGKISRDIAERLMILQKGKCPVCRVDLRVAGFHLDHMQALSNGGAHEDSNIQLLCPPCNLSKHAKHPVDFMQSRGFLL